MTSAQRVPGSILARTNIYNDLQLVVPVWLFVYANLNVYKRSFFLNMHNNNKISAQQHELIKNMLSFTNTYVDTVRTTTFSGHR